MTLVNLNIYHSFVKGKGEIVYLGFELDCNLRYLELVHTTTATISRGNDM